MTCTKESFLKDVAHHTLETIKDDGLYRHIRFREPGTMIEHFDLITWPGYLCYTGDMGTYVFSRLSDMFEFFRTDRRDSGELHINQGYWSEKLQAVDGNRRNGSATEFSEERFTSVINEYRINWMRERVLTKEQRRELWEAVDEDVLGYLDNGEQAAYSRANDFSWRPSTQRPGHGRVRQQYYFQDVWERNFHEYTYHFTWCCYALAWGIQKYDEAKSAAPV